jgi:hypothetical protein
LDIEISRGRISGGLYVWNSNLWVPENQDLRWYKVWEAEQACGASRGGGDGKMNAQEYCDIIMDGEMYDFWEQSSEELGYILVMEDGAPYHMGCATTRRKELQEVG